MPEYIEREIFINNELIPLVKQLDLCHPKQKKGVLMAIQKLNKTPIADVVEVVRCKDCKHCHQLAPHSEINRGLYFHCGLWRGEETKNVWHKYKKYYADYSLVCADDYCSCGELKEREGK